MKWFATALGLALSAALVLAGPAPAGNPGHRLETGLAAGKLGNFNLLDEPRPVPEVRFVDGAEEPRDLAGFRGRVVLLNLWATWCAPCRREMPALDRLEAELGGPDFQVVALAVDRGGLDKVTAFLRELGIRHLEPFVDPTTRVMRALGAYGLPTTLIIDREGREIGRLIGPAEWDSPEIVTVMRALIAEDEGAAAALGRPPPAS